MSLLLGQAHDSLLVFKMSGFLTILREESLKIQQEERMEMTEIIMRGQLSGHDNLSKKNSAEF